MHPESQPRYLRELSEMKAKADASLLYRAEGVGQETSRSLFV